MIQLPSAPIEAIRIINIRFGIYIYCNRLSTIKRFSKKIKLHRVLELELELISNDSKIL